VIGVVFIQQNSIPIRYWIAFSTFFGQHATINYPWF